MNKIDKTVGEAAEKDILHILGHIRPSWSKDQIFIKVLKGGSINRSFTCGLRDDAEENDVIVIRVFNSVGGISDREKEVLGMRLGNHLKLAPQVYCRFNNGMAYKYEKGCNVTIANQTAETFARGVAKSIARLHLVHYQRVLGEFGEGDKIEKYKSCFSMSNFISHILLNVPERYEDADREAIRKKEFMTKVDVLAEVRRLDRAIDEMQFPIVFCHNDLNIGNIVFDETAGRVNFVDWEVADVSYCINDIGVFFFGHTFRVGVPANPDHLKLYPSKKYQCQWIRWYLEYKAESNEEATEGITLDQVERIYKGSNLAAMRFALVCFAWLAPYGERPYNAVNFESARHAQAAYWRIKENFDKGI